MNKTELKELLGLEYNEENEQRVLKALEDMEENEENEQNIVTSKKERVFKLELVIENDKKASKVLKPRVLILKDEINEKERLLNKWIKPTVKQLNDKYLSFMEAKYEEDINKYVEELKEEKKGGKGGK